MSNHDTKAYFKYQNEHASPNMQEYYFCARPTRQSIGQGCEVAAISIIYLTTRSLQ
jgi:hypothetical protein